MISRNKNRTTNVLTLGLLLIYLVSWMIYL